MEADKEGFLRAEKSLIQTIGRAARKLGRASDHVRRSHDGLYGLKRSAKRTEEELCRPLITLSITSLQLLSSRTTTNALLEQLREKEVPVVGKRQFRGIDQTAGIE